MTSDATDNDLEDAFRKAAGIASLVPEPLQAAAFDRALDELLGRGPSTRRSGTRRRRVGSRHERDESGEEGDPAARLLEKVNRTDHPEIAGASKVLDRALYVLKIASDELNIDGLKASHVARVLTDKFRVKATRQGVGAALDSAGKFVDRTPRTGGAVYRIMQPGEDFLASGGSGKQQDTVTSSPKRAKTASARRKTSTTKTKGGTALRPGKDKSGSPRRSGRKGPRTALNELIAEGYFKEPHSLAEIRERLQSKKGLAYKPTDLSPALVRMLREEILDRDRNEAGTYEYRVP